jgi:hypothetical protein
METIRMFFHSSQTATDFLSHDERANRVFAVHELAHGRKMAQAQLLYQSVVVQQACLNLIHYANTRHGPYALEGLPACGKSRRFRA